MPAKFNNPQLGPDGLLISGTPFNTRVKDDELIGVVPVRFMIINVPEPGSGGTRWKIDGVATWKNEDEDGDTFKKLVPTSELPAGVEVGNDVRGIGLSVLIRHHEPEPGEHPAPPYFETITWCVNLEVVGGATATLGSKAR